MRRDTPLSSTGGAGDDFTDVETGPSFDPTNPLGEDITASTDLRAAPARDELEPGEMLGDYRIEGEIGRGGMGVVLAAVHPLIGKRAAIKVLRADLCTDPMAVARFVDEARVVNQIGHPNIVDVFTFGVTDDGRSYLVMEWLKGESLRERLARAPMPLVEMCRVLPPLIRALVAAHDHGVVHRDLKPDNVFLVQVAGEEPHVKLLDFGIAKLADKDRRIEKTASGALIGTPLYVAPEQAKGVGVDQRADIYALGVMMFELVTGRPPFLAQSAMEVIAKHLMEPPPLASTFARVPRELDELLARMLAKEPAERPALAEVSDVIGRVARDGDRDSVAAIATAVRPTVVAETEPRSRGRVIAGVAGLAIAVALGAYAIVHAAMGSGPAPVTPAPPVVAPVLAPVIALDAAVVASEPLDAAVAPAEPLDAAAAVGAGGPRPRPRPPQPVTMPHPVAPIGAPPIVPTVAPSDDHDRDLLPLAKP